MREIKITKPNRKQIKWAIGREFDVMAEVDPVFRPGFISEIRRFIWRFIGLPSLYQRAQGYLANVDGVPAGFSFSYVKPMMMRIDSFMVLPEYRNQGAGSSLLNEITEFAKEFEVRYLVSAIPKENPDGFEYAKKKGFLPYRNFLLSYDNLSEFKRDDIGVELDKILVQNAKTQYDKWVYVEMENGDPWALELINAEFADLGFNKVGTHWNCLVEKSNKGYLRLIHNGGKGVIYMACEPEYWNDPIQLDWIRTALNEAGAELESLNIMFASGGHHQAAKELFSSEGFVENTRKRFLVIKDLGEIKQDEDEDFKEGK
jgi:GNAT superfamily N-acetyltransferase